MINEKGNIINLADWKKSDNNTTRPKISLKEKLVQEALILSDGDRPEVVLKKIKANIKRFEKKADEIAFGMKQALNKQPLIDRRKKYEQEMNDFVDYIERHYSDNNNLSPEQKNEINRLEDEIRTIRYLMARS